MATSVAVLGTAYVAGQLLQNMNNQKKEEVLHKLQKKKIMLLEEKTRWLIIKNNEERRFRKNEQQITELKQQIQTEEKAISQYEHLANDSDTKFCVVLGNTGDGKSTLCNRLTGDESEYGDKGQFFVSDDAQSQTTQIKHVEYRHKYAKYVTVDTPGINDSENKDNNHINDLVHYFILVRNGTNIRFDGNFQKMLFQYFTFFGNAFWNHLVIVLTRIEGNEKERFVQRRKDLELQQLICQKYGLKKKVPVMCVGNDSFKECVENIRLFVSRMEKFECSSFRSPIDELRDELDLLVDSMDDFGANLIDDAQENIQRIDAEIVAIEEKIENPSQIPLINSGVKKVKKSIQQTIVSYYK